MSRIVVLIVIILKYGHLNFASSDIDRSHHDLAFVAAGLRGRSTWTFAIRREDHNLTPTSSATRKRECCGMRIAEWAIRNSP